MRHLCVMAIFGVADYRQCAGFAVAARADIAHHQAHHLSAVKRRHARRAVTYHRAINGFKRGNHQWHV